MGYSELNEDAYVRMRKYKSEGAGSQSCVALYDGLCFESEKKEVREKYCISGNNRDCSGTCVVGGGFE